LNRFSEYIDGVKDGSLKVGSLIKKAIERHEKDMKNPELEFRVSHAQHAIDFIALLEHSTDSSAGKPFLLEPWQVFLVGSLFGWYWKGTERRRYTSSYIQVARKNGKSALAIAISLYHFVCEGHQNAEVLVAANSVKQAKDVLFKLASDYVNKLDPKAQYMKLYYNEIRSKKNGSYFKVMASDVKNLAGYNCSFGIIDEYYSAQNHQIRELFRTSQIMRENKHLMTITTAGFDLDSPCYELRNSCINILNELSVDEYTFVLIYELDEGMDWTLEENWSLANPNLDITVRRETLEDSIKKAISQPAIETDIRTLNLNQWMQTREVWLPDKYLKNSFEDLNLDDFDGQECIIGVDLASVSDLTAVVVMFEKEGHFYFFPYFYIPRDTIKDRSDENKYNNWIQRGLIDVTPGNVTDYDYVTANLLKIDKKCFIKEIAYDKYNATQWAVNASDEGLPLREFSQSLGNFNGPSREMERIVMDGKAHFQKNEILMSHFRSVEIKHDHNGNIKPMKKEEYRKKIDGVIASIQALGVYYYTHQNNVGMIY